MIIYKRFWVFSLLLPILLSCEENETTSVVQSIEPFPITSSITPIEVPEADSIYTFDFNIDDRQIIAVDIVVEEGSESTATLDEDYHLEDLVSLQAYAGGFSVDVEVLSDLKAEGNETVYLRLYGDNGLGQPEVFEVFALTIRDSVYAPAVEMDWEGTFSYAGAEYSLCGNIDIDMFITDADGNEVDNYQAATGACPETSFLEDLPDGTYTIYANLYNNGLFGAPDIDEIPIPITISLYQGGVLGPDETDLVFSTADIEGFTVWDSFTPSDPNGDAILTVATFVVNGDAITLIDAAGNTVGTLGG